MGSVSTDTFSNLDVAMGEFRRVLRPAGLGVIYQVITGPAMTEDEAQWLASQETASARSRPPTSSRQSCAAGLLVRQLLETYLRRRGAHSFLHRKHRPVPG
ncbi:MAG TPA: hypothetical protein VMF65_03590 [Acidimicrobiales bacterium]|nr:hypothetical protein [Acidimicrobiales bacterium]